MAARHGKDVTCPVCSKEVPERFINEHLDNGCKDSGPSTKPLLKITSTQLSRTKASEDLSQAVAPLFNRSNDGISGSQPRKVQQDTASRSHAVRRRDNDSETISVDASTTQPPSKRAKTISSNLHAAAPLAERLRPQSLSEFVGQPHLTGPDSLLMHLLESKGGVVGSMIFWGPPGCGKTTLARLIARQSDAVFKELSATVVGINDVRAIFEEAKGTLQLTGRRTILFLDEVHRFNRAQQDIFLPYVEQGHIQLIGATTENPSFKVNGALLSRCRVFVLERLTDDDIREIVTRAIQRASRDGAHSVSANGIAVSPPPASPQLGSSQSSSSTLTSPPFPAYPHITPQILASITSLSTGDARTALSLIELALFASPSTTTPTLLDALRRSVVASYDRTGDTHYDLISALHKSVRGSDGSAALYWLARMLAGGEDPVYVARRMVVCASEDIGLADKHALPLAIATLQACQFIGMPECRINLAHLVSYLAEAPKSTRAYTGYNRAEAAAKADMTLAVPLQIRNAPTRLMKELGYAKGYMYNPDFAHPVLNEYLPESLRGQVYLRKEGDMEGKEWDEDALRQWEEEKNEGVPWEGRLSKDSVLESPSHV